MPADARPAADADPEMPPLYTVALTSKRWIDGYSHAPSYVPAYFSQKAAEKAGSTWAAWPDRHVVELCPRSLLDAERDRAEEAERERDQWRDYVLQPGSTVEQWQDGGVYPDPLGYHVYATKEAAITAWTEHFARDTAGLPSPPAAVAPGRRHPHGEQP